jgi:DNA-binding CsgD family transcriptional regulator
VKKITFLYGLGLASLVVLLKAIQYNYLVRDLSIEVYIGVVATIFAALGVWAGWRLTRQHHPSPATVHGNQSLVEPVENIDNFATAWPEQLPVEELGISKREYEVLDLIAQGLSNQEIADRLFVSLHTVKKHTSSLFVKLEVKRRTQAVERAKQLRILR